MERATLIAVGGLPGTGKSVVARKIAERRGALLLRSDLVRKELFPSPVYSNEETRQTYEELLGRARAELRRGRSAVLDATFRRRSLRQRAQALAAEVDAGWLFVLVTAPVRLVQERIARRTGDASDADFAVHQMLRAEFDPIQQPHIVIHNAGTLAELDRELDRHFPL